MQCSESHILTTHAGALPRPEDLLELNAQLSESASPELEQKHRQRLHDAVAEIVQRQVSLGISIVNDGEFGKSMRTRTDYGAWLSYVMQRLTGWEPPTGAAPAQPPASTSLGPRGFYQRRDRQAFPEVYAEIDREMYGGRPRPMGREVTGPITYKGHDALQADITNLRAALQHSLATEAFMT